MDKHIAYIMLWIFAFVTLTYCDDECSSQPSCLRCVRDVDGFRCIKCSKLIVYGTRRCVTSCPAGHAEELSTHYDYMGRICKKTSVLQNITMSGHTMAIIVGAICGTLLSLTALLGGCFYFRRRRLKALSEVDENSDSTLTVTPLNNQEREEFLKELSVLRRDSPVFLCMMNETRKQVRSIWLSKSTNQAKEASIQAYRPVLRDLYIILVLLNKAEDRVTTPPHDWRKLLSWGERVLKRYKRQNDIQTPLGNLVTFLQVPNSYNNGGSMHYSGSMASFQQYNTLSTISTNTLTSNISNKPKNIEELAVNTFNNRYDDDSRYRSNSSRRESVVDDNRFSFGDNRFDNWDGECSVLSEWSASREFLFNDHFVRLGFRPQDEITTEL